MLSEGVATGAPLLPAHGVPLNATEPDREETGPDSREGPLQLGREASDGHQIALDLARLGLGDLGFGYRTAPIGILAALIATRSGRVTERWRRFGDPTPAEVAL